MLGARHWRTTPLFINVLNFTIDSKFQNKHREIELCANCKDNVIFGVRNAI